MKVGFNMPQKIFCKKGKCREKDLEYEMDMMFDDSNLVDRINHDLIIKLLK
jgi:hypothetical protein